MKGDPKALAALNQALTIELTAINQYFVQAKLCANWGYRRLAEKHKKESLEEMRHADALIERIIFLEGVPEIARYDVIRVGKDVKTQLENDLKLELGGVGVYRDAIDLCAKLKDAGSREVLEHILVESEEHVDWLESQLGVIRDIGLQNYLSEQLGSDDK